MKHKSAKNNMESQSPYQRVSVVIVTHNSKKVITNCLKSIPKEVKIYLVDNASKDSTSEGLAAQFQNLEVINSPVNLGFGRGNNLALEKVTTKFALLLNPDTVLGDNAIEKLLIAADEYPNAAIIGPSLFYEDGRIQESYRNMPFDRESRKKSPYIIPDGDLCADCLSGAAMLLRMDVFRKIGFFDPKIFLFYEDDEICMRAKTAGYSLILASSARVMHLYGQSSPPSYKYTYIKNWHTIWSRLYLENKYNGKSSSFHLAFNIFMKNFLKSFFYLATGNLLKSARSSGQFMGAISFARGKVV